MSYRRTVARYERLTILRSCNGKTSRRCISGNWKHKTFSKAYIYRYSKTDAGYHRESEYAFKLIIQKSYGYSPSYFKLQNKIFLLFRKTRNGLVRGPYTTCCWHRSICSVFTRGNTNMTFEEIIKCTNTLKTTFKSNGCHVQISFIK